ncbi:C40 family peptidase [Cronobacter dublinensis]|uniref:C40 family peptidase n=1 Tax=Cronobacter dublinensis TaxID=413497 RepID=UPI000CFBF469|nr:C40 family peptidase [Cronobacter dublinensis]MDK1193754.1 C40 family peptidase [Cronobacter dublinensis]MDK1200065.1 C40 family peptidase [Cronobacter dublinensis]
MARKTKIALTLCALLMTSSLAFAPFAQASEQTRASKVQKAHASTVKKKTSTKTVRKSNNVTKTKTKTAKTASEKRNTTAKRTSKTSSTASKTASRRTSGNSVKQASTHLTAQACSKTRKNRKTRCVNGPLTIADAHKARVKKAQNTAMNKLMNQIGKPYHWGGTSPRTGFDCSGLVWYAYKDLVKFRIPRTANEMYHLRDAAPVNRGELESGDLVFFRTQGRGTADHVGVYVGNGKFIQSPRSGQEIQITSLSEDYWQRHYVGARRVMTPRTIR